MTSLWTRRGRVMHICSNKLSLHWIRYGLPYVRRKTIVCVNTGLLPMWLRTHVSVKFHSNATIFIFCHSWVSANFTRWWRYQVETFSALVALCEGNSPVTVNFPHKGQWSRASMFSLVCAWTNHRDAGDLRHHHAHYDVIVIMPVKVTSSVFG